MPGEEEVPIPEILIFELETKKKIKVDTERFKDQSISILTAPTLAKNRDDENRPSLWLSEIPDKLCFSRTSRDLHHIDNNVHPANTLRLANALIKANKRFDFFSKLNFQQLLSISTEYACFLLFRYIQTLNALDHLFEAPDLMRVIATS